MTSTLQVSPWIHLLTWDWLYLCRPSACLDQDTVQERILNSFTSLLPGKFSTVSLWFFFKATLHKSNAYAEEQKQYPCPQHLVLIGTESNNSLAVSGASEILSFLVLIHLLLLFTAFLKLLVNIVNNAEASRELWKFLSAFTFFAMLKFNWKLLLLCFSLLYKIKEYF